MKKVIRIDTFIPLAILVLAAIFRFYKLRTAPDWFMDEGEFIRLADNLSKGNYNFLGIRDSLLLIGRPPLFFWVLSGAFKIFGTDMIVLRSLSVCCSLVSIGIVYYWTQQALGKTAAFYAALMLAIAPEYIYYTRMGFTYGWTSVWMLLSLYALWKYLKQDSQSWLVTACLAAGVAVASDYLGIVSVIMIILVLALYHPTQIWKVFLVPIPFLIAVLPIFISSPTDLWNDLLYSISVTKIYGGAPGFQFARMLVVYPMMVQREPLIVLGMIGIFILPDKRFRGLLLLELLGIFTLTSFSRTLADNYLLPVWPLSMIGLGYLLERCVSYFFNNIKPALVNLNISHLWKINDRFRNTIGSLSTTLLLFVFVFLPITYMIIINIQGFMIEPVNPSMAISQGIFPEGYLAAGDAQTIAKEISQNIKPEDFVIAPSTISWMLQCNTADARTVFSYEYGGKIPGIPDFTSRYVVKSSLSDAKYAVVDNTWLYWSSTMPTEISSILEEVRTWPMVIEKGSLQLYCNPVYCP